MFVHYLVEIKGIKDARYKHNNNNNNNNNVLFRCFEELNNYTVSVSVQFI